MPQSQKRKNRVHHGGIDGGQSLGALEMFEKPLPRQAQGTVPQRLPRDAFIQLETPVERQKEIPPAEKLFIPIKRESLAGRVLVQVVDGYAARHSKTRLPCIADGQRDHAP